MKTIKILYAVIIPGEKVEHGPFYSRRFALITAKALLSPFARVSPESCLIPRPIPRYR